MCTSRLSQRARNQAFAPASMSMTTGYFRGKKMGKQNLKNFLAAQFPTYYSRNSTNGHLSAMSSFFLADSPYIDSYKIRELKQRRRRRQRERQKSNWFRLAKQQLCTRTTLFCIFLYRRCTTPTWKCLISRFVENVNTGQRLSSSYSELRSRGGTPIRNRRGCSSSRLGV